MQGSPRKGRAGEQRQQLEELLSCQVCYCRAVQPALCPHCSKLYCGDCLAAALRVRPECPNCRRGLRGTVVQCGRFVGEVGALLGALVEGSEGERCPEHGVPLNYFCEDCRRSACCECKMFGSHQSHSFKPISQLYERQYQQIRDLLSDLRTRIVHQEHALTLTEDLLISAKAQAEAHLAEIDEHAEQQRAKLAESEKGEEGEGGEDVEELRRESRELGEIKEQLLGQLEHAARVNCYRLDQQLLDRLQHILNSNTQRAHRLRSLPAAEQAIPPLQLHRVLIPGFSALRTAKKTFTSAAVEYEGSHWRLMVNPWGSHSGHALSVFLELIGNPDSLTLYFYHIELLHPTSRHSLAKHHQARFSLNECLGYAKFILIEELQEKEFVNHTDDTLTLAFGVRLCSYYDLHSRRQTLLGQLQRQIEEKEEEKAKESSSSIELE